MVSAGILEISTKANSRAFTVISSPPPHVKIASSGLPLEKGGKLGGGEQEEGAVSPRFPPFRESELIYFRSNSIASSRRKIDR